MPRCLALFGFPPDRIPTVPRRNVSLGRLALIATLAANRAAESREERARFDAALRGIRFAPAHSLFSANSIATVRDMFMADRKFLRQRFDLRLPTPEGPAQTDPLVINEQEFAEIAAQVQELGDYGARILEQLRSFAGCRENAMGIAT
ncbi:MAG TPA: hypothetical protein VMF67_01505 [Rhizomicrobium sp.]|nr:hypothetical protein [Rhizomicrobium sp.]